MILEAAPLQVREGQAAAFEDAFRQAQRIIASMPGYRSHRLERCIERPGEYLLLVEWDTLQAHEQGFRGSPQYQEWKRLLHHLYEPFPVVSHYAAVEGACSPCSGSAMPDAANTSRTTPSALSAAGKPA